MSNLSAMSDHQLVELYASGTDQAFDELLARHQEHLFAYIMRLAHNEDHANDIFQETFIKAITSIRSGQYRTTGKFCAWLMRIAHNITIDCARANRNTPQLSEDCQHDMLYNNIQLSEEGFERELLRLSDNQTLYNLVSTLPQAQQEIVHLRFWEGLSFKEIAAITGVSINTALGRMRYALINLRRIVNERELDIAV